MCVCGWVCVCVWVGEWVCVCVCECVCESEIWVVVGCRHMDGIPRNTAGR